MQENTADQFGQKIKFSIQSKILLSSVLLLLISVIIYLLFALDMFFQDKKAYVFESSLSHTETVAKQINNYFATNMEMMTLFLNLAQGDKDAQDLFKTRFQTSPDIFQFSIYKNDNGNWSKVLERSSPEKFTKSNIFQTDILQFEQSNPLNLNEIMTRKLLFQFYDQDNVMPHALIAIYAPELNLIYTSRIVAEPLENIINQSGVYQSFLMSNLGKFHFSNQSEISDEILKTALSKYVLADQMQQGVKDIPIEDKDFLISFQKMPNLNLTIVSQIAKEKAYSMAQFLIQKSFAFALMVISLAVIVGSFVSTSLTRPIETLMSATKHIANGNFKNKVDITSKDELSVLGNAFNHMSDEIIHYMEEVKEKVRMEDELAVAQLVQSSFFPADDSQYGNLAVAGHYKSASECGGDWWGSLKIGDKVFLFVGDATGHGVPAALVTATANCCANMIIELSKTNPAYLNSPAAVLEMMSNSVYKLGGKILMTFFVGIYDDKTGKLVYSNASHNSPIIYRHSPDEPNKKDIIVLMDAIGPRLGHKENPEYSDAETYLNEEDVLLLFSDGMIEAQNPKNQQWGDRRFIKSFLQYAKQSPREMINGLIKDAYSFYEEVPPDDDITLVIAKKGKNV